jgi:hypothetical protein
MFFDRMSFEVIVRQFGNILIGGEFGKLSPPNSPRKNSN